MPESLKFTLDLPVSPERVYRAWFDSYEHSQFTGKPAQIDARAGGAFSTLDGYIQGKTLVMTPFSHIVQTWRTADFPAGSQDAQVDFMLEPTCLGAALTLSQIGIPDGQSKKYLQIWEADFFRPLLRYFEAILGDSPVDMDG